MSEITRRGFAKGAALAALVLSLVTACFVLTPRLLAQEQNPSPPEFNLTLAGDTIIKTPVPVHQSDPKFMGVVNAVRRGDAAFTNLEGTFAGRDAYPTYKSAYWINPAPERLKDLQWMGFNLFSNANNHSVDFGIQGLLDTIHVFKQAGAVYAGIGENLAEARAPAYLSTPHGRVALIACASTFIEMSPAGQARPDMRGRPGLSPLRHKTVFRVDAATFEALTKMSQELKLGGGQGGSGSSKTVSIDFGGSPVTFEVSDKPSVVTTADPKDLAGITKEIRDARGMADYVVAYIHAHEGLPGPDLFEGMGGADTMEAPAQFLVQYAHAAVDAGADVFVATGPHILRGIEIYKGKPILYSLGNFIYELEIQVPQPTEWYEALGLGLDALPAELYDVNSPRGPDAQFRYWQGVVAQVVFRGGRPAEITLTPVTLGFGRTRNRRGVPEIADPATATQILERVQKLSRPFGTNIAIKNGLGIITIENNNRETIPTNK